MSNKVCFSNTKFNISFRGIVWEFATIEKKILNKFSFGKTPEEATDKIESYICQEEFCTSNTFDRLEF